MELQAEWAATAALQRAGSGARGLQVRAGAGFISPLTTEAAPGHIVGSVELDQLGKESACESRGMGGGQPILGHISTLRATQTLTPLSSASAPPSQHLTGGIK